MERIVPGAYRRFLLSWLDAPFAVGAVAPSSRSLARMMTREIRAGSRVVELGPGTGSFTREILRHGVAERDLFLLERCPRFAARLERDFPGATVLCADATRPQEALASLRGSFDFVISGLPLVLFSRQQKARLLDECFGLLDEAGALYQFTYGGRCPLGRRLRGQHGVTARRIGFVALNLPPACVFRIERART
jgi:phosphatidylethanolamine/phosphatidyl-N-methylethanolamine N-methyltransferase